VAFDATSLKSLIIERLNQSNVFTDQNFEGSNLNAFIDVVSYMYHVLLFYLNTTATETTFTTATLYENMSRLVSNLGYKPVGQQTSLATISLSGLSFLAPGVYTIPRFSYVTKNGIDFTTIKDISFEKTTTGTEELAIDNNILHQGSIREYAQYTATGEEFEVITIANIRPQETVNPPREGTVEFIADNSFTVFVKNSVTDEWQEWTETPSLYLESSISMTYEKRVNEYGNYEFKFGNNLNGKGLKAGDIVQIYYVISDNEVGVVSSGTLSNLSFNIYNTDLFTQITSNIYPQDVQLVTGTTTENIIINNPNNTTPVVAAETVDQIKENAPKIFTLQNRLVTNTDYETYITKNFNNVVKSVKVLSNSRFVSEYLNYFYNIGLARPNDDNRVLFNQVNYSDSTMFNNVYVFTVPSQSTILNERIPNYLNPTQKQLIVNECDMIKDITHNVVPSDPVFKAFNLGVNIVGEEICVPLKDVTKLVLKKNRNTTINTTLVKNKVVEIFKKHFSSITLGSVVNFSTLTNEILNLPGIEEIATRRTDINFEVPLISFVVWNPLYETSDVIVTAQNVKLADYQYGYFYEISKLIDNIIVETL
jgi:hypothetical protein